MEKSIRIGKDFNVRWSIRKVVDGEHQPYELAGKELVLQYRTPYGLKEATEWKTEGNTIVWTFRGKEQKALGSYELILTENGGKDGMVTVDSCRAFKLVAHSCEETEGSGGDIVIEDVVLESEVTFAALRGPQGEPGPQGPQGPAGPSYNDTEIKSKLAELSAEINGKELTYTRLATGSILDLTPPLENGSNIISFDGVDILSLYDEQQNKVSVSADKLPFQVDKKYVSWVAYKSGSPQVTMVVQTQGEISMLKEADALFDKRIEALEDGTSDNALSLVDGVGITLPYEITAIVGDNMQIYWRSIISAANPYIFDIYAVSSVGKSFPRYYEFKPTADMVGKSYTLDIYVKTNDGTIVAQKTATIKVAATMESPSSTKNILCIGASATAGGQWVGELNRRLTATSGDGTSANPTGLGLSNIAFVGRKVGTANAIHLEATGGWRVQDYASKGQRAIRFFVTGVDTISLSSRYSCNGTTYVVQEVNVTEGVGNIRCTLENTFVTPSGNLTKLTGSGDAEITFTSYEDENFSPFWNAAESRIDFQHYADTYCDGHIDCLIWHCGVNDITSGDPAVIPSVIADFRNLLTAYHEQFPNGKVIISSVPIGSTNGGFAANYGANKSLNYYTFAKIAQLYAQTLIELTQEGDFMDFVAYSPALEQFDAENNYPVKDVAVNNRSSIKEKQGTNAVHPIAEGSYQIADAVYRTFNSLEFELSEPEEIDAVSVVEGVYMGKLGGVIITTSPRAVASYPIIAGEKYELYVPKTGNSYASIYAFTNIEKVVDGTYCTGVVGVGNEQSATLSFTAPSYQYVYVCYTTTGGAPTLTKL